MSKAGLAYSDPENPDRSVYRPAAGARFRRRSGSGVRIWTRRSRMWSTTTHRSTAEGFSAGRGSSNGAAMAYMDLNPIREGKPGKPGQAR